MGQVSASCEHTDSNFTSQIDLCRDRKGNAITAGSKFLSCHEENRENFIFTILLTAVLK